MKIDARAEPLSALLQDIFGRRAFTTVWAGPVPSGKDEAITHLAERIGYPKARWNGSADGFVDRTLHEAAVTLAMLATQSQAYEFNRPPPEALTDRIEAELGKFLPTGRYVCNADHLVPWVPAPPAPISEVADHRLVVGATRVVSFRVKFSTATFDTGIIGFDNDLGFIAWAEDED